MPDEAGEQTCYPAQDKNIDRDYCAGSRRCRFMSRRRRHGWFVKIQRRSARRLRMHRATGTFEVKLAPQKADNPQAEAAGLGRMSLDKQFHGDLEAAGHGAVL